MRNVFIAALLCASVFVQAKPVPQTVAFTSVGTNNLQNNAVTNPKIAQGAVGGSGVASGKQNNIIAGTITNVDIHPAAGIKGAQIASNAALANGQIGSGAITATHIADGSVTNPKLATDSVSNVKIAVDAVEGSAGGNKRSIKLGSITSSDLSSTADITGTQILDETITNSDLADNSVYHENIADGSIKSADISNEADITGTQILDFTITSSDIENDAITTVAIEDGAVNTGDLALGAVTSEKIADGAVSNDDMAADSVMGSAFGVGNIVAGSITGTELADGSVSASKLAITGIDKVVHDQIGEDELTGSALGSYSNILDGSISGNELADSTITGAKIAAGTITNDKFTAGYGFQILVPDESFAGTAILDHSVGNEQLQTAVLYAVLGSDGLVDGSYASSAGITTDASALDQGVTISFAGVFGDLPIVQVTPLEADSTCFAFAITSSTAYINCLTANAAQVTITGPANLL